MIRTAGWLAATGEIAIGILLALPSRAARRSGVILALLLGLGIVLTPPPNNAGHFSLVFTSRLIFFLPEAASETFSLGVALFSSAKRTGLTVVLVSAFITFISLITSKTKHSQSLDPAVPAFCAEVPLFLMMIGIDIFKVDHKANPEDESIQQSINGALTKPQIRSPTYSKVSPIGFLMIAVTAIYSFLLPMFGLLDTGFPQMFSNLRFHGRSNHFMLPTVYCKSHSSTQGDRPALLYLVVELFVLTTQLPSG